MMGTGSQVSRASTEKAAMEWCASEACQSIRKACVDVLNSLTTGLAQGPHDKYERKQDKQHVEYEKF